MFVYFYRKRKLIESIPRGCGKTLPYWIRLQKKQQFQCKTDKTFVFFFWQIFTASWKLFKLSCWFFRQFPKLAELVSQRTRDFWNLTWEEMKNSFVFFLKVHTSYFWIARGTALSHRGDKFSRTDDCLMMVVKKNTLIYIVFPIKTSRKPLKSFENNILPHSVNTMSGLLYDSKNFNKNIVY